jgi:hypothetical protein
MKAPKKNEMLAIAIAAASFCGPCFAGRYTYTYTGTNFTYATGCVTTADHLSITLVTKQRIKPGTCGEIASSIKSIVVGDGAVEWGTDRKIRWVSPYFELCEDKRGQIYSWQTSGELQVVRGNTVVIQFYNCNSPGGAYCEGSGVYDSVTNFYNCYGEGQVDGSGTWTGP